MRAVMLVCAFVWLAACQPMATPTATLAPTATSDQAALVAEGWQRLTELSEVIGGRMDALAADDALLTDDGWRRAMVVDLREAALLCESLAMRSVDRPAALRAVGGAYQWLADSVEAGDVIGVASASFALGEAQQGLR